MVYYATRNLTSTSPPSETPSGTWNSITAGLGAAALVPAEGRIYHLIVQRSGNGGRKYCLSSRIQANVYLRNIFVIGGMFCSPTCSLLL